MIRDEVFLIGREAIVNSFCHSQGSKIEVEVDFDHSALRLRVRDDGQGIGEETLRAGGSVGHWGLSGMRERAEKMGARFRLWNRSGAGTEVEVTVPGAIAYQDRARNASGRLVEEGAEKVCALKDTAGCPVQAVLRLESDNGSRSPLLICRGRLKQIKNLSRTFRLSQVVANKSGSSRQFFL